MRHWLRFGIGALAVLAAALVATLVVDNEYFFFAGYVVLQFVVLATAWNILGGYAGYVNFGSGAFFAVGAYVAVALIKAFAAPLPVQVLAAMTVTGLMGFAVGAMTLRLRGIFFSIATVAIAVICETVVHELGVRRRRARHRRPAAGRRSGSARPPACCSWSMTLFALLAVAVARTIETSWIGRGLRALRDSEEAAESLGVPTLKLKLFAATVSGALMGLAGAPFPLYMNFIEPTSAFSLNYAVSALAMPIIGGTASWIGPVIGAVLLGSVQQIVTVTVSSELNVLVVGALLVVFVVIAPQGHPRACAPARPPRRRTVTLLQVNALSKRFGGFAALTDVRLTVTRGERLGIIGPNGSGKTTLINCICGALTPRRQARSGSTVRT